MKCKGASYLVHGILWDDLERPQCRPQVHEHDGNRPQGCDGQDTHKWVDPYGRTADTELKRSDNNLSGSEQRSENGC